MGLVEHIGAEPRPARGINAAPGVEDVSPEALENRGRLLAEDALGDHIPPGISASRPCSSAIRFEQ